MKYIKKFESTFDDEYKKVNLNLYYPYLDNISDLLLNFTDKYGSNIEFDFLPCVFKKCDNNDKWYHVSDAGNIITRSIREYSIEKESDANKLRRLLYIDEDNIPAYYISIFVPDNSIRYLTIMGDLEQDLERVSRHHKNLDYFVVETDHLTLRDEDKFTYIKILIIDKKYNIKSKA